MDYHTAQKLTSQITLRDEIMKNLFNMISSLVILITVSSMQTITISPESLRLASETYEIELHDIKNNDEACYSSSYTVTNMSETDAAQSMHHFYPQGSGTAILIYQDPALLVPLETRTYHLDEITGLPIDFIGHVLVESNQPITGEVLPFPPCDISVDAPSNVKTNIIYTFTANITPEEASVPITYTWYATDLQPVTHSSGVSDSVELSWTTSGWKQIRVTTKNSRGSATIYINLWITDAEQIYLPITMG